MGNLEQYREDINRIDPEIVPYYVDFQKQLMEISCAMQYRIISEDS